MLVALAKFYFNFFGAFLEYFQNPTALRRGHCNLDKMQQVGLHEG